MSTLYEDSPLPKPRLEVLIDGVKYTTITKMQEEELFHLTELYGMIWIEACYDGETKQTIEYAKKLLPHIKALNVILQFKK